MQKLDRGSCPAPACLRAYDYRVHKWAKYVPTSGHRETIATHLETMQGRRCAYCEGDIDTLGRHIEHFRRRSAHPSLTFEWDNLFWSCDQTDSCGRFKDEGAGPYNVADLINPCADDPDAFFIFQADGTISIRHGLSAENQHRASETLRVFSLDAEWGRLRAMRKIAVSGYVEDADTAFAEGWSPDDIRAYFAEELEYARHLPFYTAIRHTLTGRQ